MLADTDITMLHKSDRLRKPPFLAEIPYLLIDSLSLGLPVFFHLHGFCLLRMTTAPAAAMAQINNPIHVSTGVSSPVLAGSFAFEEVSFSSVLEGFFVLTGIRVTVFSGDCVGLICGVSFGSGVSSGVGVTWVLSS